MKYPNGVKQKNTTKKEIKYANRGMTLEGDINLSNNYYIEKNIAYIYKKPTPIQLVKVNYPERKKAVITEAYFKEPSTLDYNGLYKGYYIDFDAKETNNKTSFPLGNINKHQIEHIRNITKNDGICFLIVRFNKLDKTYLLMGGKFIYHIDNYDRKSIPIDYFQKEAYEIKYKYNPRLDYITIIDRVLGGKNGY